MEKELITFTFERIETSINKNGKIDKHAINLPTWTKINRENYTNFNNNHFKCRAVITGKIGDLTVIDFDDIETYHKVILECPELKNYKTIKTRKGYHIYCQYDERMPQGSNVCIEPYIGIDVRNDGGMVYAPPTSYSLPNGDVVSYEDIGGEILPVPNLFFEILKNKKVVGKKSKKINESMVKTESTTDETDMYNDDIEFMRFREYIDTGLLSEVCKSGNHCDWVNVGYAFINIFGIEGIEKAKALFYRLTMNYGSENKKTEVVGKFNDLCEDKSRNKKVGRTTIMNYAKKIDADKVKEINRHYLNLEKKSLNADCNISIDGDDIYTVADDDEASDIILELFKNDLIYNRKRLFLKCNHVWNNDEEYINNYLLTTIMKKKIYKKDNNDKLVTYSKNVRNAKNIREAVLAKIKIVKSVDLYDKFHSTTKGRICYSDGVLDFIERKFYTWDEIDELNKEYYSINQIDMNFKDYFDNPNKELMDKINSDILIPLFGDKIDRALHFFSRAIAGHTEDKKFMSYLGNRDSGKGVLNALFEGYGNYTKSLVLDNMLCSKNALSKTEASRMLYWLMDFEFVRLGISQETPKEESGLMINAVMWKKLCGGDDTQTARRNQDRHDTDFKCQMTPAVFGNNSLTFTENDCKEHEIEFHSIVQFKSKTFIDELKKQGVDSRILEGYKISDETLKPKCKSEEYRKAFMMIIYESYKSHKVEVEINVRDEERQQSIAEMILKEYVVTGDDKDNVVVSSMLQGSNKKKVQLTLEKLGVLKKKGTKGDNRGKYVYGGIREKTEEEKKEEEKEEM
jgi:hypothetical protein